MSDMLNGRESRYLVDEGADRNIKEISIKEKFLKLDFREYIIIDYIAMYVDIHTSFVAILRS